MFIRVWFITTVTTFNFYITSTHPSTAQRHHDSSATTTTLLLIPQLHPSPQFPPSILTSHLHTVPFHTAATPWLFPHHNNYHCKSSYTTAVTTINNHHNYSTTSTTTTISTININITPTHSHTNRTSILSVNHFPTVFCSLLLIFLCNLYCKHMDPD